MSFGPELIWCWSRFLSQYIGRKAQRVEAADNWLAISLSGAVVLLLSWDARACGVAIVDENDKKTLLAASAQTPPIVNALKRHIVGGELAEVKQLRQDRVLRLTFKRVVSAGFSSTRHLVLEATERYSNMILTDEDMIVMEATKHIHPADNRFRTTLPGFPYALPPVFDGIAAAEWILSPTPETITKICGFGAPLLRALASSDINDVTDFLSRFYDKGSIDLFSAQKIGKYVVFAPKLPCTAQPIGDNIEAAGYETTVMPLLVRESSGRVKIIESHIGREVTRREKQCSDIRKLLEQDPEKARKEAEIIMSNVWQIEPGSSDCTLDYWDEEGKKKTADVSLNPALTPQKNAAALFAKYKKLAAAQKRAEKLLEQVQLELAGLREQLAMVSLTEDSTVLASIERELGTRKEKKSMKSKRGEESVFPPHKRYDLGFALVFSGLSANGNRYVTFNLASPEDIWFHVYGAPGSHVILRYSGTPSEDENSLAVKFAASLAAWFSKARENAAPRVDYTRRKYVSAIKGGIANVTYKEFKSFSADPLFWKEYLAEKK